MGVAHVLLMSIHPTYKIGVERVSLMFHAPLLAIILVRAKVYSWALTTLRLSGTVYKRAACA